MLPEDSIKEIVFNLIKEAQGDISFRHLTEATGLDADKLYAVIGKLVLENRIRLSVNPFSKNIEKYMSRDEVLYARFIDQLSVYYKQERSVAFYASKLCISSKYLSSVVKAVCGKTPTELIREKTIDEIESLLQHTQLSIKEIAYELNFPNISFFGKYFKAQKGVSPKLYREKMYTNKNES